MDIHFDILKSCKNRDEVKKFVRDLMRLIQDLRDNVSRARFNIGDIEFTITAQYLAITYLNNKGLGYDESMIPTDEFFLYIDDALDYEERLKNKHNVNKTLNNYGTRTSLNKS